MPVDARDSNLSPEQHRRLGIELFNFTWTLIEKPDRTATDIDTMIDAAHASAHHWREAAGATPNNLARSQWQLSRVYSVLRRPEPALWHARRVLEICEQHGIGDWDLAFAYEALARASRVGGDAAAAEQWLAKARDAGERIEEAEERELLFNDLATI